MNTLGGGNGDGWPPENGGESQGLPGLPPEWGTVIIPNDPAELASEAAALRREMRRRARRAALRRRLGLPPRSDEEAQPSVGLPLLIMAIAVLATLTSLFALAWPGRTGQRGPAPQTSRNSAITTQPPATRAPTALPELALADAGGKAVRLRQFAPAAVLLVEGCSSCEGLVADTAAVASPSVTIVVIDRMAPAPTIVITASITASTPGATPGTPAVSVRRLADPQGHLRDALGLSPAGTLASVVLVAADGAIVARHEAVASVESFRAELSSLS